MSHMYSQPTPCLEHTRSNIICILFLYMHYMYITYTRCAYTCISTSNTTISVRIHVSTSITTMGWLRLVGSLKLQISFGEYRLFDRALLQKRPVILRSLLIVATPYINAYTCISTSNTSISSVPCVNKEERYTYCVLKYASHANCMYLVCVQPIPLGVTFSNAVSKLKTQSSNVSFATFQWKETFEL